MPKRRYTRYTFEDTQRAIQHQQWQAGVRVIAGTASANGRRIQIYSEKHRRNLWVVLLARSSHWYRYCLNTYDCGIEAIVAGTHDSCVSVPILAMDTLEWHEPYKTRFEHSLPLPKGLDIRQHPDRFELFRRSHYGHCVLVGALIVGRQEAIDRLMTFPPRTRRDIEGEVRRLRHRRPGRPLQLWDTIPKEH
ncbi:hypothetical protein [Dictyobacter kobayashii]|uniref:Uncharacterized protein n=1 Tax=Dictyobacter kobayashii TaxID=2014872 RepID=A0A402AHZ8_9CHLR|nr:hypothetical protein [Dictyobacter kobayashii]GCE18683.1 hypothetical protein KDK_24830 [Dictyobacter kobayashii]